MKTINYTLVLEGSDVLIYEQGWWMRQETRRKIDRCESMMNFRKYTLDRNERTKEITVAYLF